jgi:nucleotide-binding universal stress UspA family protein
MKLLIAYDGSPGADAALADLHRAHLPENTQALVLTVADVWLPPESLAEPDAADLGPSGHPTGAAIATINFEMRAAAKRAVADADTLAFEAAEKLRRSFPGWQISSEARADSPAWGVLAVAEKWHPDLLLAGATGHSSTLDAWLVGTVSQKIVTKARCSVRIGRGVPAPGTHPRLVIGFDGSPDALAAVAAVAARSWPAGSEARLVTALNPRLRSGVAEGAIPSLASHPTADDALDAVMQEAACAVETLREAGLIVSEHVRDGEPREVLLEEAKRWEATAMFLGAKGLVGASGFEHLRRFFIGSTSTAIVWRAGCTVEVARAPDSAPDSAAAPAHDAM